MVAILSLHRQNSTEPARTDYLAILTSCIPYYQIIQAVFFKRDLLIMHYIMFLSLKSLIMAFKY